MTEKRKPFGPRLEGEKSLELISTGGDESVCVVIRVRPFNKRELDIHESKKVDEYDVLRSVAEMPDGICGKVRMLHRTDNAEYEEIEVFQFTKSLWSVDDDQQKFKYAVITQTDTFNVVGKPIITNARAGINSCVFAYGQTGSGKTHTMMGDFTTSHGQFTGDPGLIPRLCQETFQQADSIRAETADTQHQITFDIKLSAIEIYNEHVRDLFWKNSGVAGRTKTTALKVRNHPTEGAFVDQLTVLQPKNWLQCINMISAGVSERTVAATLMNPESSRSHSIFIISLVQNETMFPPKDDPSRRFEKPVTVTKQSKINLVDLAGSERLKKSGAQGQHLKEAAGINLSLTTLKKVIDTLVQNATEPNPRKHAKVPYRDSTLTQLLSHSLGGNSKTTMISCISPHYDNQEETLLTLRYANRAKGIVNHIKVNEDTSAKQAALLKDQIKQLQSQLESGQESNPHLVDQLRDEIEVGERHLKELHERQKEIEQEKITFAKQIEKEKNARFLSSFYISFKRVFKQKQRDIAETQRKASEKLLNEKSHEREDAEMKLAKLEMDAREKGMLVGELKRRKEFQEMRAVRHEAMARQLVRDIAKTKKRLDDQMVLRYGIQWQKNQRDKRSRLTQAQHMNQMKLDHEQSMQSIVREAKRQHEELMLKYDEEEEEKKDRLRTLQNGCKVAENKAVEARREYDRLLAEFRVRQKENKRALKEKNEQWQRRYTEMESIYLSKLQELERKKKVVEADIDERLAEARQKVIAQHAPLKTEITERINQVNAEGQAKRDSIVASIHKQRDDALQSTHNQRKGTIDGLLAQYDTDSKALQSMINNLHGEIDRKIQLIGAGYDKACDVAEMHRRCVAALGERGIADVKPESSDEFRTLLKSVTDFVDSYHRNKPNFADAAALLNKHGDVHAYAPQGLSLDIPDLAELQVEVSFSPKAKSAPSPPAEHENQAATPPPEE